MKGSRSTNHFNYLQQSGQEMTARQAESNITNFRGNFDFQRTSVFAIERIQHEK